MRTVRSEAVSFGKCHQLIYKILNEQINAFNVDVACASASH